LQRTALFNVLIAEPATSKNASPGMFSLMVTRVVRFSIHHPLVVILLAVLLTAASVFYSIGHFAINTDVAKLIDSHDATAERDRALGRAFPDRDDVTLVVVTAPAAELADAAADQLSERLALDQVHIRSVVQPASGAFFEKEGLLFLDRPELDNLTDELIKARPLLNSLARDPTLRGLSNLMSVTLGVPLQSGQIQLADMKHLLTQSSDVIDQVLQHQAAAFSYQALLQTPAAAQKSATSLIEVHPVLDYTELAAGAASASAIRNTVADLQLKQHLLATVRLTGATPLADEEFSSVAEGALPNAVGTLLVVIFILFLALRSGKLVFATAMVLVVGLPITGALGLLLVGAYNMISVAFAVLFVGIGIDFSLQFGVRYREERHNDNRLEAALEETAQSIAKPLTLAALATALSFFAFLPTDYRGVSELGEIAGVGILFVAFPLALTLLPALMMVLKPGLEPRAPGYPWLAPLDRFFEVHRIGVLIITGIIIIGALPLLYFLHFDFNPLHLKDPHSESMATLATLSDAPDTGVNDVNVLSDAAHAAEVSKRLSLVPEVGRVVTLANFIPEDQPAKLAAIGKARLALAPVLDQPQAANASDGQRVAAINNAAMALNNAALDHEGDGAAEAKRLAAGLKRLAAAGPAERDAAELAFGTTLKLALKRLSSLLQAEPVSQANLPKALLDEWQNAQGQQIVEISPKVGPGQSASDERLLARFADAVQIAEPDAVGGPISILASANTIERSFLEAAILALIAITVVLWIALRRFADVLRTLIPLLVSLCVTLELCVVFGINLNFANIIALPLLLGVGVAFKIYYVLAWRAGRQQLLQSSLTQAVLLSAATTGTAFGSLWLSHHPGTSSMGKLLALSLFCTLIGAVFFQPILMGRPRQSSTAN
jgi:hopanoid biosynthesis associated RND transporter like protein HpnN